MLVFDSQPGNRPGVKSQAGILSDDFSIQIFSLGVTKI